MDIILDIFGCLIYGFFGALVGVLWPPKSQTWLRWQKIGMAAGISAMLIFVCAFGVAYFSGWVALTWWLFGLACLLTALYMIVGNICRTFHESMKDDS
jgi:peptidoglycan/LPS O-acetylase OafA/YrhL